LNLYSFTCDPIWISTGLNFSNTEAAAKELRIERGVRLRGADTSRFDTFVDAAFAFAVTLLLISVDEVPGSYGEFMRALAHVPAFLACFVLLMLFWWGHHSWSRCPSVMEDA
jgi:hypothetical protein